MTQLEREAQASLAHDFSILFRKYDPRISRNFEDISLALLANDGLEKFKQARLLDHYLEGLYDNVNNCPHCAPRKPLNDPQHSEPIHTRSEDGLFEFEFRNDGEQIIINAKTTQLFHDLMEWDRERFSAMLEGGGRIPDWLLEAIKEAQ